MGRSGTSHGKPGGTQEDDGARDSFALAVSSAERGVVVVDREGRLQFMSPRAERMLGLDWQRHRGAPLGEACEHPACGQDVVHHWKAAVDGGGSVVYQVDHAREGAHYRCVVEASALLGLGVRDPLVVLDMEQYPLDEAGRPVDRRLAFEGLLSSIALRLLRAPGTALDDAIDETLHAIGRFMGADRAYLFRLSGDGEWLTNTHEWCAAGVSPQMHRAQHVPARPFLWHLRQLERFGFVLVPCTDALPDSASALREELKVQGIRSMINVALQVSGRCAGFVGFDAVRTMAEWGEPDLALLRSASVMIGHAMERRRIEDELRASQAGLRRAQQIAGIGTWRWDRSTGQVRCSGMCARICGAHDPVCTPRACWERLHPEDRAAVRRALGRVLRSGDVLDVECRVCDGAGGWRAIRILADMERSTDGRVRAIIGVVQDVTEQHRARSELAHLADHDPLTGLPNRRLFERRLREAVADARRRGARLGVLFVDPDDFKRVNDRLGHHKGDSVLQIAANRLRGQVRRCDLVARRGGDEFTVLICDVGARGELATIACSLGRALAEPLDMEGETLRMGASIGIAVWPEDAEAAALLETRADQAMYQAKGDGGGRYRFCSPT